MSFKTVTLGDVCSITGGGTPSKSNPNFYIGDIPWATVRDMNRDNLEQTDLKISKEAVKESSTNIIPKNNVVIATRVGLGKVCIIKQDTAINQDLRGVVPKNEKLLDVNYLFYWFKSISKIIVDAGRGATVHGVTLPFVKSLQIPLPSLFTQQKIVSKIDAIFAEIDKATAAAEANAKNAEALFQSYLTQVFENSDEVGSKVKFLDILNLEYGKALPDCDRDGDGVNAAYGANGVKTRTNKFLYSKPSIIIGRKGSAGELTLVQNNFWALDVTYYVTHDEKKTDLMYLYYALKTKNLPSYARGVKPGINRNDIYELEISLPPLVTQQKIVAEINAISNYVTKSSESYLEKVNEFSMLKKSILSKAFVGELIKD